MPQIFHHSTNALAKITIYGAVFILVAALWATAELNRSSWNTGQWVERQQPVQFSHRHHVGDDGLDCRYCHTSVETAASAGIPSTNVCMKCRSYTRLQRYRWNGAYRVTRTRNALSGSLTRSTAWIGAARIKTSKKLHTEESGCGTTEFRIREY